MAAAPHPAGPRPEGTGDSGATLVRPLCKPSPRFGEPCYYFESRYVPTYIYVEPAVPPSGRPSCRAARRLGALLGLLALGLAGAAAGPRVLRRRVLGRRLQGVPAPVVRKVRRVDRVARARREEAPPRHRRPARPRARSLARLAGALEPMQCVGRARAGWSDAAQLLAARAWLLQDGGHYLQRGTGLI
mgnify:CR=1 FL=1